MYPCEQYLAAAKDLVSRYPQLKDKSRTHCASWHASIKNRARKAEAKAHRERRAALPCNQQCRPKNAVRIVFPAASCGTGEDEASVQVRVDFMKKEMEKAVWAQKKVQDAMNRTYKARRAWLNTENLTVAVVTDRYPALAWAQEIQQEFRRQTGRDAQEGLTAFLERSTKALYKLFCMKSSIKTK
uniref:Putative ultrahigh sulfur keratin-associated protein n=1 Tax=Ixodes ricinus TaxID=34613 RepID=A0A0K8R3K0_IXORI